MHSQRQLDLTQLSAVLAQVPAGFSGPETHIGLARQAARISPAVGRLLLALEAGLLDSAETHQILNAPHSDLLGPLAGSLPQPPALPGQGEAWVRGLAALLLAQQQAAAPDPMAPVMAAALPDPDAAAQPLPPLGTLGGVWNDEARWLTATQRALASARQAGQRRVTLAVSSWGAWLEAREVLTRRYGAAVGGLDAPISVITLEDAVALLSAASAQVLPDLGALLGGPLLLDGVDTLGPDERALVTALVADTATVFGFSALLMSAGALRLDGWAALEAPASAQRRAVTLPAEQHLTLETLAEAVRGGSGDTLVVLPSRGSAARLAALLPGSLLWSSSLCPVHLGERAGAPWTPPGGRRVIVATALPPGYLGPFETVWHTVAPLPHLAEAWKCCAGSLRRLRLRDVALPVQWVPTLAITDELLRGAAPPEALDTYLDWAAQGGALQMGAQTRPGPELDRLRADFDYAALASALQVRPATSRPALIPYDAQARALAAQAEQFGHLPTAALRYAAWLTPGEAALAVRQGQARSLGWALLWDGAYDPVYGLAGKLIEDCRYARGG
jgi:hypothetical protein